MTNSGGYTIGSLCAGVGGFDLAFDRSGFDVKWAVEIDPKCRAVLRRHFQNTKLYEDVNHVDGTLLGGVDVVTYGFPCTDLSVAGKRRGFFDDAGKATRSGLFFGCLRIVKESNPRVAVFENVPGLLSHDGGETFKTVIDSLDEAGFDTAWITLDSRFFGVPQRRRRVFGISTRKTERGLGEVVLAKLQLIGEGVRRDTQAGGAAGERIAAATEDCVAGSVSCKWAKGTDGPAGDECQNLVAVAVDCRNHACGADSGTLQGKPNGGQSLNYINPVCVRTANTGANGHGVADNESHTLDGDSRQAVFAQETASTIRGGGCGGVPSSRGENVVATTSVIRRLTPVECCRLQAFPDDWNEFGIDESGNVVKMSDSTRYKQMGNAVTVNVVEWIVKRIIKPSLEWVDA